MPSLASQVSPSSRLCIGAHPQPLGFHLRLWLSRRLLAGAPAVAQRLAVEDPTLAEMLADACDCPPAEPGRDLKGLLRQMRQSRQRQIAHLLIDELLEGDLKPDPAALRSILGGLGTSYALEQLGQVLRAAFPAACPAPPADDAPGEEE